MASGTKSKATSAVRLASWAALSAVMALTLATWEALWVAASFPSVSTDERAGHLRQMAGPRRSLRRGPAKLLYPDLTLCVRSMLPYMDSQRSWWAPSCTFTLFITSGAAFTLYSFHFHTG